MLRVLIADDEFDARDNMISMIDWEGHGMKVVSAADNGLDAYESIINLWPDIVLIDIQMRGMSGLEVIERVRKSDCMQPVFIIISGYDDFLYTQKAISLHVDGYLLKPFRPRDVLSIIESHFGDTSVSKDIDRQSPGFGALFLALALEGEAATRHPVQEENEVVSAMLSGTQEDLKSALTQFYAALGAQKLSMLSKLNSCVILYAEICRHLHKRNSPGQTARVDWNDKNPMGSMQELLLAVATDVQRDLARTPAKGSAPALRAKAYIDENFARMLSLESVAQEVSVTSTYLSGCFARDIGIGFVDYIKNVRVAHAKRLLASTGLSVSDVCARCGFQDTKYFRQVFKQLTGLSPHAYREQIAQDI